MITRYFDATVEGWKRISIVQSPNEDALSEVRDLLGNEIDASDLPEDFSSWQRYTAGAYACGTDTVTYDTVSPEGA